MLRQLIATQAAIDDEGFLNTLPRIDGAANSGASGEAAIFAGLAAGALIGPYRLVE